MYVFARSLMIGRVLYVNKYVHSSLSHLCVCVGGGWSERVRTCLFVVIGKMLTVQLKTIINVLFIKIHPLQTSVVRRQTISAFSILLEDPVYCLHENINDVLNMIVINNAALQRSNVALCMTYVYRIKQQK